MLKDDRELNDWLRKTIDRLSQPDSREQMEQPPPPRYDDPGVQRRIADLIGRIALEPERERSKRHAATLGRRKN